MKWYMFALAAPKGSHFKLEGLRAGLGHLELSTNLVYQCLVVCQGEPSLEGTEGSDLHNCTSIDFQVYST